MSNNIDLCWGIFPLDNRYIYFIQLVEMTEWFPSPTNVNNNTATRELGTLQASSSGCYSSHVMRGRLRDARQTMQCAMQWRPVLLFL